MKYTSQVSISGGWVDKSKLTNGQRAKIVGETKSVPSNFTDEKTGVVKNQDVAKVQFEGQKESVNVALNRATINGLIMAFGDESMNWQGHYLTTEVEKMRVAGKAVTALYLIPEGYEKVDDAEGYAVIQKKGTVMSPVLDQNIPIIDENEDPRNIDTPF